MSSQSGKVILNHADGRKTSAIVWSVEAPKGWLVLTHMMPALKESWAEFAAFMQERGYASIAIDLYGHGESDRGPEGYKLFTDEEHQAGIEDIVAAAEYWVSRGVQKESLVFIGASIGANLSLQWVAEHSEYKAVVLLSPGINYKGVEVSPLIKKLQPGQKVFYVSSKDDERTSGNNALQNQQFYDETLEGVIKKIKIYDDAGHGTNMFRKHPELFQEILAFIQDN